MFCQRCKAFISEWAEVASFYDTDDEGAIIWEQNSYTLVHTPHDYSTIGSVFGIGMHTVQKYMAHIDDL